MWRRYLTAAVFLAMFAACSIADASWMVEARKFQKWCERPAKSMSFGQSAASQDRFVNDIQRQLRLLKIPEADVQVSIRDQTVKVHVEFRYPSPERYVVRRQFIEDVGVKITERIDHAWQVNIVAQKGKLLKSEAVTESTYETY